MDKINEFISYTDVKDAEKLWDIIKIFNDKINELVEEVERLKRGKLQYVSRSSYL